MLNMSECPAIIKNIEINFIPEIQSTCKLLMCAGLKSFFKFDTREKVIRILGKVPSGVSCLFVRWMI